MKAGASSERLAKRRIERVDGEADDSLCDVGADTPTARGRRTDPKAEGRGGWVVENPLYS